MSHVTAALSALVLALAAAFAPPPAPPISAPPAGQPAAPTGIPPANPQAPKTAIPAVPAAESAKPPAAERYRSRLEALDPANPEAYFRLGEDVLADADDRESTELARHLFVLTVELDRRRSAVGGPLAASACVALASQSRLERDRRWLLAIAALLDPRQTQTRWRQSEDAQASQETAYRAATALGLVRSGDGAEARQKLDDPAVMALLRKYDRLFSAAGVWGGVSNLQSELALWPCRECGNTRVVKRPGTPPEFKLCPSCNGNPGPKLSLADYLAQLRFESWLLSGIQRSWGAQLAADLGRPLRDPDPAEIAPTYDVDAGKTVFRNGSWVAGKAP